MKLTEENLDKVFRFIYTQISDDVFGLFDEETDLLVAFRNTIEHLKEGEK